MLGLYEGVPVFEGDIFFNPQSLDYWIILDSHFMKINDGHELELNEPSGFQKVGHIDFD